MDEQEKQNRKNHDKFLKIVDLIEDLSRDTCSDCGETQFYTQRIILQSLIWGSTNFYEGLGIVEDAKDEWKEMEDEFND